jgi:hypothetical protein
MKLLVGLVVGLAALSGCSGGDPEPKVVPTQSVASTPSVSPTEVESSDPPQALSPVQTVRAWVKALNHAMASGDTSEVGALSAERCKGCLNFRRTIEGIYAHGGRYETEGWTVVKAKARSLSRDPVVVVAGISVAGGRTIPEKGAEPVVYSQEDHLVLFKLTAQGDGWLVSFLGFVS